MKTYTDSDVRKELRRLVKGSSYRLAGQLVGLDAGNLHKMVHGKREVTVEAAAAVGFEPIERAWKRKPAA